MRALVISEHWSAGLTYRRAPSSATRRANTVLLTDSGTPFVAVDLKNVRFKVPDQFGAGLSWHPTDSLVVNLDADYIQYSQLTHGIESLFGNDATTASHLSIPNGAEVHLGGEYTFTQMAHPFSLRAGVWHDPRHSIEYTGDPGTDLGPVALAALFHGGKGSQTHVAVGGGLAFAKFQIGGGGFLDQTDTLAIGRLPLLKTRAKSTAETPPARRVFTLVRGLLELAASAKQRRVRHRAAIG